LNYRNSRAGGFKGAIKKYWKWAVVVVVAVVAVMKWPTIKAQIEEIKARNTQA